MRHVSYYLDKQVNAFLREIADFEREQRIKDYSNALKQEEEQAAWFANPHNFGPDYE